MQLSVIADCGVSGVYRYGRAVVIVGACAGEKVKDLIVTGVCMLSDGITRGKHHVVEHPSLAVQFRITDGDFKDAEGVIKRIKNNKRIVVEIKGVAAVAITFVPAIWLEPIEE